MLLLTVTVAAGCASIRDAAAGLSSTGLFGRERVGAVRRIAVLPFAFRGSERKRLCTLCPAAVVMARTSETDAQLVAAFFYEALTRHPRFDVVPFELVERFAGQSMEESLAGLRALQSVDAVVVGALLELRPRIGDPLEPRARAGAAIYAALIDADSGAPLWSRVYDADQALAGRASRRLKTLLSAGPAPTQTALEVALAAADEMVANMARVVD